MPTKLQLFRVESIIKKKGWLRQGDKRPTFGSLSWSSPKVSLTWNRHSVIWHWIYLNKRGDHCLLLNIGEQRKWQQILKYMSSVWCPSSTLHEETELYILWAHFSSSTIHLFTFQMKATKVSCKVVNAIFHTSLWSPENVQIDDTEFNYLPVPARRPENDISKHKTVTR